MFLNDITSKKVGKNTISLKSGELSAKHEKRSKSSTKESRKVEQIILQDKDASHPRRLHRIREISVIGSLAFAIIFVITLINLGKTGLNLKASMVSAASLGFEKIMNGVSSIQSTDFGKARKLFEEAGVVFQNIDNHAWFTTPKFPALTVEDPVFEAGRSLIDTGKYLSKAGSLFAQVTENLQFLPKLFFEAQRDKQIGQTASLTKKLKEQMPFILESSRNIAKANSAMQKIPSTFIPAQLRDRFNFAKEALGTLTDFLKNLETDIPAILMLLGDSAPHTYLILLQNNAETRPAGGFIGNYMLFEMRNGYISRNEVFDVYSADHNLKEDIAPPAELLPITKRWYLHDSNYSGHFPLSAAKAAWFLEKTGGPGVDSVIAIDQSLVQNLLELTGPVSIPELSNPLTKDNFATIISFIVEAKITGRSDPKAVLRSFMPALQKALFERVSPMQMLQFARSQMKSKHLMAYSKDTHVQNFFERYDLAGLMTKQQEKEDYLSVIHTSIGGNKSDAYINETLAHSTYLKSDGSLIDELTITRTDFWNDKWENYVRAIINSFGFQDIPREVFAILGGSPNIHMLRVYVPNGSALEESSDSTLEQRFDEETGKTYFSVLMKTPINKSSSVKIRYKLPFKLNLDPVDQYRLILQKQPGQNNVTIEKRIFPDSRVLNYKYFPESGSFDADGIWNLTSELIGDMTFSSIWGK